MTWADFYLIVFPGGLRLEPAGAAGRQRASCTCRTCTCTTGSTCRTRMAAASLPWFNFGTLAAFLAWFGGTAICCSTTTASGSW